MYLPGKTPSVPSVMYDCIFSISNRSPFLFTTLTLHHLNLQLVSSRMTERSIHATIEECNWQLRNILRVFLPNEGPG